MLCVLWHLASAVALGMLRARLLGSPRQAPPGPGPVNHDDHSLHMFSFAKLRDRSNNMREVKGTVQVRVIRLSVAESSTGSRWHQGQDLPLQFTDDGKSPSGYEQL